MAYKRKQAHRGGYQQTEWLSDRLVEAVEELGLILEQDLPRKTSRKGEHVQTLMGLVPMNGEFIGLSYLCLVSLLRACKMSGLEAAIDVYR